MSPTVDIVIVSYNTRDALADCLASLGSHPPSSLGRIVVVDNASTDGSPSMIRDRWPSVHLVALDENRGFGAANNVALRLVDAPFVLLLNSDTLVPAGAVDGLLQTLLAADAVAAGPRLVDGAGRVEISFGPMLNPWSELRQALWQRLARSRAGWPSRLVARHMARERIVDWATAACLLVRRDAVQRAGFFDERYFMYEEDVDLCAALRAAGGTILYTPRVQVTHLRGQSVNRIRTTGPSHYDRSHVAFYEKHSPFWAPWLRTWLRLRGRPIR